MISRTRQRLVAPELGALGIGIMLFTTACSEDGSAPGQTGGAAGSQATLDASNGGVRVEAGAESASAEASNDDGDAAALLGADSADGGDGAAAGMLDTRVVPVSGTKADRLFGVTFDAAGNIFATGHVALAGADAGADDYAFFVIKFLPTGAIDRAFGENGVALKNVAVGGGSAELPRGIVVQTTGKIVIAGTVEHDVTASAPASLDRDIALVRFNANGSVDTGFGMGGVVTLNLNDGVETRTAADGGVSVGWAGADAQWSLDVYPDDKLLVHGNQRAEGVVATADGGAESDAAAGDAAASAPRTDNDFALVRLTADGAYDSTFGTGGKLTLDIGRASGSARGVALLPDGRVVASGYATTAQVGNTLQAVLYRVTTDGKLDTTFGVQGVFHQAVLTTQTEAYAAVLQGDRLVTIGYGRETTEPTDVISLRFGPDGAHDTSWGVGGVARFDVAGFADNGRSLLALPNDKVLLVGAGRKAATELDGFVALLTASGAPDTSFAPGGFVTVDFGGPNDALWGCALSPDKRLVALVGTKGVATGAAAGAASDDAVLVLLPTPR